MEGGLLELTLKSEEERDNETIHNVFRAAHSIKGGSATFGFNEIMEFTHSMENILDTLRGADEAPDPAVAEVLLQATDCLRELVQAQCESREPDSGILQRGKEDLDKLLTKGGPPKTQETTDPQPEESPSEGEQADLEVIFHPHREIFLSGNDPLRYIDELNGYGITKSAIDVSAIPNLADLNPEYCFLKWTFTLADARQAAQIRDIFEWIEDECDLTIGGTSNIPAAVVPAPVEQPAAKDEAVKPVAAPVKVEEAEKPEKVARKPKASSEASTIRVATDKLDSVVNLVGELVITQSMLTCIGETFQMSQLAKLREGIGQLSRNTRELQETVLKIRMLPIGSLFDRFPRTVYDLCSKLGKRAKLKISGEQTEVDKTVLEKLSDPLLHLVRNSMDHGIETPEVRRKAGKPEEGTLRLHAEHRGGNVFIEIADDGGGLNQEAILARARQRGLIGPNDVLATADIYALIFSPGFSTVEAVTDLSGRGVGMDVVRKNVQELGGRIEITSRPGLGTTTTIQLPLTLAIMEGQLLRVGDRRFVVPLTSIVESLRIDKSSVRTVAASAELYRLRNEYLPIVHLNRVFNIACDSKSTEQGLLVVVESQGRKIALKTDDLLAQQQVVVKSLEANFRSIRGLSGATILGDGTIALILDIAAVIEDSRAAAPKNPPHSATSETKYEHVH